MSLSSSPNELKLNIEIDHYRLKKHSASKKLASITEVSSMPVLPAVKKMKKIKPSLMKLPL